MENFNMRTNSSGGVKDELTTEVSGYEDVCNVSVPERTVTYHPISNKKLIEYVKDKASSKLNRKIAYETYGLSQKNKQMFGTIDFDIGDADYCLTIGVSNSYNSSIGVGVCLGLRIKASGLHCFHPNDVSMTRRHTSNAWESVQESTMELLRLSLKSYSHLYNSLIRMKDIPRGLEAGYQTLGMALGKDALLTSKSTIVFDSWKESIYPEFEEFNLYRLYMAALESVRGITPARKLQTAHKIHAFFESLLAQQDIAVGNESC